MKYNILVTISVVILVSTNGCIACYTRTDTQRNLVEKESLKTPGESFYQECSCDNDTATRVKFKWLDIKDREIGSDNTQNLYTTSGSRALNLQIRSVSRTLHGSYKCVAETMDGKRYVTVYPLIVYDSLYFHHTNTTQYLIRGRNSSIICEATGYEKPSISWSKDMEDLIVPSNKYTNAANGVTVNNVVTEDEGTYTCTARVLDTSELMKKDIKVEVLTAPTIEEIRIEPSTSAVVGDTLILECIAVGNPIPTYSWYKISNSSVFPNLKNIMLVGTHSKLVIENILPEDGGNYVCHAQNIADRAAQNVTVDVQIPPVVTELQNITGAEGQIGQIICKASGEPLPNITFEDNENIKNGRQDCKKKMKNDTETECSLTIDTLKRSHAGFYSCIAYNDAGEANATTYLSVLFAPRFEKSAEIAWVWPTKSIQLSCDVDSLPPAGFTWTYQKHNKNDVTREKIIEATAFIVSANDSPYLSINGSSPNIYGVYACEAKNNIGHDVKRFYVFKGFTPQALANVSIIDIKGYSATFYLEGPDNSGPPLTAYSAEYNLANVYNVTSINNNSTWAIGNGKTYKLDKLLPNKTYSIRFAAINEVGSGPFSEVIEFETPERSIPEPLKLDYELNATLMTSSRSMMLILKAPVDNGAPIDYFTVKYCPVTTMGGELDEHSCNKYDIKPTKEIHLKNLQNNSTYYLMLVAHNSEGYSEPTITHLRIPEVLGGLVAADGVLSGGAIIGISIVVVVLCMLLLDALLLMTRKQGMMASCCFKKKKKDSSVQTRDKKGLLKDNGESAPDATLKRPDNGHKEFEYNKTTGIITGKHSAV